MTKRGAKLGNRNAAGPRKRATETVAISELIVPLYDRTGLSYAQIASRLSSDFGISLTRTAVWQRYQRGKAQ